MIANNWLGFVTPQVDLREYFKITGLLSLATRITGAASFGPTPQNFFIGGVDSWINPTYQTQGIPITTSGFRVFHSGFTTSRFPVLCGNWDTLYDRKSRNYVIRFPLRSADFPLRFLATRSSMQGPRGTTPFISFRRMWRPAIGKPVDLLLSTGTGIRTYLFGFYIHFDMAWTTNIETWSTPNYIISLGEDF